jgi:hypothetical protein
LREEEFALMYCMKGGMTYSDIQGMSAQDREWHLARLYKQLKWEEEELKKERKKLKISRRRR